MLDCVIPFQLEKTSIRGRIIRLDKALKTIISQHNYPALVNKYLSETILLAAALSDCFKFDGLFTLQISGSGPLRLIVVDIDEKKNIRGCARFDEAALAELVDNQQNQLLHVVGAGYMAFTIDPKLGDNRYQGTVELEGATLSEATHHFFRQSEQLETGIVIKVNAEAETVDYAGAAMMIQRLPIEAQTPLEIQEQLDDQWIHSISVISSLKTNELLDRNLSTNDLLYRLFWESGVRVYEPKLLVAKCRCSNEKITTMLSTFPQEQLEEMVFNNQIEVTCEFCGQAYVFPETQIAQFVKAGD